MKPKKQSGHSPDEYAALMVGAVRTHQACSPLADRLGEVLAMLNVRSVARPTDWNLHYTGAIELRWHNGSDRFGSSTKWVGLLIGSDAEIQIRGNTNKKSYSGEGGISIAGLPLADAVEIVRIVLRLVQDDTK